MISCVVLFLTKKRYKSLPRFLCRIILSLTELHRIEQNHSMHCEARYDALYEAERCIASDDFTPKICLIIGGKKEKHW